MFPRSRLGEVFRPRHFCRCLRHMLLDDPSQYLGRNLLFQWDGIALGVDGIYQRLIIRVGAGQGGHLQFDAVWIGKIDGTDSGGLGLLHRHFVGRIAVVHHFRFQAALCQTFYVYFKIFLGYGECEMIHRADGRLCSVFAGVQML